MKGTEKQIKWAQDIINTAYADLSSMESMTKMVSLNYTAEDVKVIRDQLDVLFADPRLTASMVIDIRGRISRQQLEAQAIAHHNLTK